MRYRYLLCGNVFLIIVFILFCVSNSYAIPTFNADKAFDYLKKQCSFGPRPPGVTAHEKTKDYLATELKKYANSVVLQNFTHKSGERILNLTNIIAIFGPNVDKKVILAAHWDTRPFADRDSDPKKRSQPILGANDGASGVAVLLELARAFRSETPPIKIIMVLFDGEDYGKNTREMFLGSRHFARKIRPEWVPEYGILLDMIGDKDLDIYIEQNSINAAPDVVRKVWNLADDLKLKGFYRKVGYGITDDHIELINVGIECIDIIDFNYPYWHTLQDTPDKCSPQSLETIGKLLLELIYH
jgi:Zn-dependent M28 family amino/carboxypeptidase